MNLPLSARITSYLRKGFVFKLVLLPSVDGGGREGERAGIQKRETQREKDARTAEDLSHD